MALCRLAFFVINTSRRIKYGVLAGLFFLFIHYSHATYQIMARLSTVRFLSAVRAVQAPLCPPPRPVPRRCDAHQGDHKRKKKGDYKGKESEREGQRKRQRKACPPSLNRSCRRHEVGRWEEKWSPPSTWLLSPRSQLPKNSHSSASDTSLTASSSAGTRLPTPVVERNSSTARPHLSSARRSRIFHRSFPFQVSFRTSAHRVFCWAFHSGHALKRCSRVWFGYRAVLPGRLW